MAPHCPYLRAPGSCSARSQLDPSLLPPRRCLGVGGQQSPQEGARSPGAAKNRGAGGGGLAASPMSGAFVPKAGGTQEVRLHEEGQHSALAEPRCMVTARGHRQGWALGRTARTWGSFVLFFFLILLFDFFFLFFYRLRAEYENHQPKHFEKKVEIVFFVLFFVFFFPQKVSVRLHRSGLHGRRGKSNTFDYVQASPGPAPLPMVHYRYIYIVALCTVCIDLYIGMYRLPGALPSRGSQPRDAWGGRSSPRAGLGVPRRGTASVGGAGGSTQPSAPSRGWRRGWGRVPCGSQRGRARATIPCPAREGSLGWRR